jgi:rhodanese-related sulfurtransferase
MQNWLWLFPLVVGGGVVLARLRRKYKLRCAGVREVGVSQTLELINKHGAVVVDVREDKEYYAGRIPKARHVPLSQVRTQLDVLEGFRDRPIVVSCRSGQRSAAACLHLCQNGFSQVYNLKGGIIAWRKANLPLEK